MTDTAAITCGECGETWPCGNDSWCPTCEGPCRGES